MLEEKQSRKGWTYIRTIFSEIKFLGWIDNKIFLSKVLRFAQLKRASEGDNNNNASRRMQGHH